MANTTKQKITSELREIERETSIAAKSHFEAEAEWSRLHLMLGIPATALSAIAAGLSGLTEFAYHNVAAGIIAILVSILTGLLTFLNPKGVATQHHNAGADYNELRSRAHDLHEIEADALPEDKLTEGMKDLNTSRFEFGRKYPQPPGRAYRKAEKSLQEAEAQNI